MQETDNLVLLGSYANVLKDIAFICKVKQSLPGVRKMKMIQSFETLITLYQSACESLRSCTQETFQSHSCNVKIPLSALAGGAP
jgi:hypothetical protein